MIINNIIGGLGNAMFQIAAGYAHSLKCKTDYAINYSLPAQPGQGEHHRKYKTNIFSKIKETDRDYFPTFNQDVRHFNYRPIPIREDLCLQGYFQSDKYFKMYEDHIRDLFFIPQELQKKMHNKLRLFKNKKIGIHIRWGDYKDISDHLPPITKEYIYKAVSQFNDNQSDFILFTDDLDLVKQQIDTTRFNFLDNTNELEDLVSLSMCDSVIMSNSSFSWWGSWLGKTKEKVIAPKDWFGIKGPWLYDDIFRDEMTVI